MKAVRESCRISPTRGLFPFGEFGNVVAIKPEDTSLRAVDALHVLAFHVFRNRLGHTSHEEIFAPEHHAFAMEGLGKRLFAAIAYANCVCEGLFSHRPKVFLEIEGIEADAFFLGGYYDVGDIFLDGDERSRFHVVVASVGNEVLDELARRGKSLNFVEHNEGLAPVKLNSAVGAEVHKEAVEVVSLVEEDLLEVGACLGEVDKRVGAIFFLGELFCDGAFADASCPFNEDGACAPRFPLSFEKLVVAFSSKHTASLTARNR